MFFAIQKRRLLCHKRKQIQGRKHENRFERRKNIILKPIREFRPAGIITYYYQDKQPIKRRAEVPVAALETIKEFCRDLAAAFAENKDTIRNILMVVLAFCFIAFFPELAAPAALLFLLLISSNEINNPEINSRECIIS